MKTDKNIWNDFRAGDDEALEYIYRKYAKVLFHYGYYISTDKDLLSDSVQELFCYLIEHRHNLNEINNLNGYLLISFRRLLLSNLKKRRENENRYDSINDVENIEMKTDLVESDEKPDPELLYSYFFNNSGLSKKQKEALYLKFIRALSYEEVGGILGIKYQSCRTIVYRALIKLRISANKYLSQDSVSLKVINQ